MAAASRRFAVRAKLHYAADAGPTITVGTCNDLTTALTDGGGDVIGCALTAAVTGAPDGCECRLNGNKCPFDGGGGKLTGPPKDTLNLTGISPGVPYSNPALGGSSVINCMYWFWPDAQAADTSEQKAASIDAVKSLVDAANSTAAANAAKAAVGLWDATPTPFATTPTPTTTTTTTTPAPTTTTTVAPTTTVPPTTTTTAAPTTT